MSIVGVSLGWINGVCFTLSGVLVSDWGGDVCCTCTLGDGVAVVGTLGAGMWRGRITLGDATCVGGNCVGIACTGGNMGVLWVVMVTLNRLARLRSAFICSPPNTANGDTCAGRRSASVRILASSAALSLDEVVGMFMLSGKKSTVRVMHSVCVFDMYTV